MKKLFLATALLIGASGCSHSSPSAPPPSPTISKGQPSPAVQPQPSTVIPQNTALMAMRDKIEAQRQAINQEKIALDAAIARRDNQVHFGKDFLDTVAYGISSGALTYDFMKKTGSVEKIKGFFTSKNVPELSPSAAVSESTAVVPVIEEGSAAAGWVKTAGTAVVRTTELASAAVLGAFFIGDVYRMGNDVVVWFDTTEQIREQRMRLARAENSLETAEQNVDTAIQTNIDQSSH